MLYVRTGNPDLNFKVQGQKCTYEKEIRVRLDQNVKKKLRNGTLVEYIKPKPEPKPVIEENSVKSDKKKYKKLDKESNDA